MVQRLQQINTRIRTFLANLSPAWGLFLLSPVLGELVSAYLSPVEFFFPMIFIITVVPYGCGALIARELVVRNGKGWVSLLILGLAFGLFFEGIVTRIVFNPNWEDLGALGEYSRYYGFNWMLAEGVVQFQGVLSIFAAVILANLIYHEQRHESWIDTRTLLICMVVLPAWTLVLGLFVPYVPPLPGAFALIAVVAGLIGLALVIPKHPFAKKRLSAKVPRPWLFGVLGAVVMTNMMVCVYILPDAMSDPFPMPVMFTFVLIVDAIAFGLMLRWTGGGARWDDRHRLALVMGIITFYVGFGLMQDISGLFGAGDTAFAGRCFVSIITVLELRKFWPRIVARVEGDPPSSDPPPMEDATLFASPAR